MIFFSDVRVPTFDELPDAYERPITLAAAKADCTASITTELDDKSVKYYRNISYEPPSKSGQKSIPDPEMMLSSKKLQDLHPLLTENMEFFPKKEFVDFAKKRLNRTEFNFSQELREALEKRDAVVETDDE